jgi:hypothetical protein
MLVAILKLVTILAIATPAPSPTIICGPFVGTPPPDCGEPRPAPTVPIDFDAFCHDNHAGGFQRIFSLPDKSGVAIACSRADFIFTKSAVPQRVDRWPGAVETARP